MAFWDDYWRSAEYILQISEYNIQILFTVQLPARQNEFWMLTVNHIRITESLYIGNGRGDYLCVRIVRYTYTD